MSYNRKEKLRGNIEAIRTAFQLDVERRPPTDAEWELLSKYAGFGGLKCILQDANEISDAAKWNKATLNYSLPPWSCGSLSTIFQRTTGSLPAIWIH